MNFPSTLSSYNQSSSTSNVLENHQAPIVGGFGGGVRRKRDDVQLGQLDRTVEVFLKVVHDSHYLVGHVLEGLDVLLAPVHADLEVGAVYGVDLLRGAYGLQVGDQEGQLVGRHLGSFQEVVPHHVGPVWSGSDKRRKIAFLVL